VGKLVKSSGLGPEVLGVRVPPGAPNYKYSIVKGDYTMEFLKGYRTVIFGIAVVLAGLGEMVDVINVVSPELGGLALLLSGIGTLVLRYLTTTPIGVSETKEE